MSAAECSGARERTEQGGVGAVDYLQRSHRDAIFVAQIAKYSNSGCPIFSTGKSFEIEHGTPTSFAANMVEIASVRL